MLEYAVAIWNPYHLKDTNKMEIVLHRTAKFFRNRSWQRNVRDSIGEMQESFKLPMLKQHGKCAWLTLYYNIVHKYVEIPAEYLSVLSPITMTRSNHDHKFLH